MPQSKASMGGSAAEWSEISLGYRKTTNIEEQPYKTKCWMLTRYPLNKDDQHTKQETPKVTGEKAEVVVRG